jgi:hypothetical protein
MTVTVTGPPNGQIYIRPVGKRVNRAPGKTVPVTVDAEGMASIEVEPDLPYRVVIYTADREVFSIEDGRVWQASVA